MFKAMQKRIATLERSLKVAQQKIREHELANEAQRADAQSISSAPSDSSANESALPSSSLPMTQFQLLHPQSPIVTSAATNVDAVQPLLPPHNATRCPMYTATRVSPPIYTSSTNGSAVTTANGMYPSSTLPPHDAFLNSLSSTVPIPANVGSVSAQFSTQPRKLQDLPEFSGKPEDWPIFFTAYTESTAVYGYSCFENNLRLQKSLRGEAREAIKSLLIHPNNVGNIIEQLRFRYGRPEQLIRSQLAHVREIAPISESSVVKLIPFATKIANICAFLRSACGGEQHLANPTLLDELVGKLPMSKRIEWAVFASSLQPYATVQHFSDWLTKLANVICTVYDGETARDSKRRVVLHAAESQRHPTCPICQGQHKPADCSQFSQLTVPKRWEEVKRRHLCFSCLNAGHGSRNCQRRKPCATDGCKRFHHKLLHEIEKTIDGSSNQSLPPRDRNRRVSIADPRKTISTQTQPASRIQSQGDTGVAVLSCSANVADSKLLFRILPVVLYGNQKRVETYALFDEGSSITMLDNALIEELGLRGRTERLNLQWFGGRATQEPAVVVDLLVSGANMQKRHKLRRVYGVSNLQLPSQSLSKADLRCHEKHLNKLAVQPYAQVKPKLLIGLDHCHLGLPSTTMQLNKCGPFAANTELGWVVFGPTTNSYPTLPSCLFVNLSAKILMREVWKHDIRWDEPLPNNVNAAWECWRKQLSTVAEYVVPRYYFLNGKPKALQLHVFVDASEDAFAAVAYWRSTNAVGEVEVAFISAKTKCAPMKSLTVPRLELQAAVLGTRLMSCVREEHSLDIDDCIIWSDSKTVIQWLRSEHRRYKPFVQHRIAEILAPTTTANWRWLPTEDNVADEATRANNFIDFSSSARWTCGPPFLLREEQAWPSEGFTCNHHEEADKELCPKFALAIQTGEDDSMGPEIH
ncbi:PREDICTED: uncharacterized protein LOC108372407 [Rhagoletis zephyria]|uniref:uncharacterized protein LOC108372407 n=1 Tax=Rhagoletis zephyria TaxID=28612 RepID=UPI000811562B|nr:PREDICTED: uncharacterized protein LOC108372407 [Rhagoletis zephyria]